MQYMNLQSREQSASTFSLLDLWLSSTKEPRFRESVSCRSPQSSPSSRAPKKPKLLLEGKPTAATEPPMEVPQNSEDMDDLVDLDSGMLEVNSEDIPDGIGRTISKENINSFGSIFDDHFEEHFQSLESVKESDLLLIPSEVSCSKMVG
jgi:hypothetical protein